MSQVHKMLELFFETLLFENSLTYYFVFYIPSRTELSPHTTEAVSSLGGVWESHSRSCCPRLLFHFRKAPTPLKRNPSGLKRLEHAVEDQLYFILRKTRIITNVW